MGIFNQHSDNQPQQQGFLRGMQGSPGVGFNLTKDGNHDMLNKKLKNVGEGVESGDAITKHQLEVSMNTKLNKTSLSNYVKKKLTRSQCSTRYERLCHKKYESNTW